MKKMLFFYVVKKCSVSTIISDSNNMKTQFTFFLIAACALSHAQTTQTFSYTGTLQMFVVPPCVNEISVDVKGAQGGNNGTAVGGSGGRVQADIVVTSGDTFYIFVGGAGITSLNSPLGGFNGGGGTFSYSTDGVCGTAGTGGGASDIRFSDTALTSRIAVGGGGGGAGGYVPGNQIYDGGAGGTLIAADGVPWPTWPNSAGKGGNQIIGGPQGVACCGCPTYTTDGGLGTGGFGAGDCAGGGGGGGGYYGGGGSCFGGGGGGSNYASSTISNIVHTAGFQPGDGEIKITYTASINPPLPAGPVSGPSVVCEGASATYSIAPVTGATGYNWTVPAGAVINSGQNTVSVSVTFGATSGMVNVTPNNSCGSSDSASFQVTVNPNPVVNLGADITQCGLSIVLDAQNAGSTFLWSTGATTHSIIVSTSGQFVVTVTNTNGCSAADTINITINPVPNAALTLNPSSVCINWAAYALTGGTPSGGTYSGTGVSAGMFNPGAAGAGTWPITYTYTDTNNCTDSATQNITVDLCSGIELAESVQALTVSPNPSSGNLWIEVSGERQGKISIRVFDIFGKKVFAAEERSAGNSLSRKLNLEHLAGGMYSLQVISEHGTKTGKIIIAK
jgi:hypothetical protein